MDILWFQLLSVSAQLPVMQLQTSLSISELLTNLLSANVQNEHSLNSELFLAYLVLSVLLKRSSYLAAFFMSCILFEWSVFDPLSEASLYLLTFAIYSYVISCKALTFKQRIACGILLALSIALAYDAYFYGIDGIYGAHETIVYNNIEHLALYAHIIFISTLIPYRRIGNSIRHCVDFIVLHTRNSAYFVIC